MLQKNLRYFNEFLIAWNSNAYISVYYMALSHKDWELPNSGIWLAEMDIDRGRDCLI